MTLLQVTKNMTATAGVTFSATLGQLINDTLQELTVWLWTIWWLIVADMFAKWYEIYLLDNDEFRFSKAIRVTLLKVAVYFSAIVALIYFGHAGRNDDLKYWSCGLIGLAEVCSILKHILKVKGYNIDVMALLRWWFSKREMPEEAISKTDAKEKSQPPC